MVELLKKIRSSIKEEEVIDMIKELIAIPSYPGVEKQETAVAEYFYKLFYNEGIDCCVHHVKDGRSNVIATLKGDGGGKTLLLTGHTDTVPPYDMENPFTPAIVDNKLYGRGAVDMKGPLACMAAAIIGIKRAGIKLKGDVIFAGVIDEEHKSEGTIELIDKGLKADAAIVGEPTSMNIAVAHRGLEWLEFHFNGKTVHGGKQAEGNNAISMAAIFIDRVNSKLPRLIEEKHHHIIGTGSFNLGTIVGGTQPSTVAGKCVITLDRRWLPGESYLAIIGQFQEIIKELTKENSQFSCEMKVMDVSLMREGYVHEPMEIDINHEIIEITGKAIERNLKCIPQKNQFPAWTDAGLISSYANIPTIVLGPGSIESAHSENEHIDINQIHPAVRVYEEIILNYCNFL